MHCFLTERANHNLFLPVCSSQPVFQTRSRMSIFRRVLFLNQLSVMKSKFGGKKLFSSLDRSSTTANQSFIVHYLVMKSTFLKNLACKSLNTFLVVSWACASFYTANFVLHVTFVELICVSKTYIDKLLRLNKTIFKTRNLF